ncbi:unnamed protein product [Discosporangium mesarthrocarpum]
MEDSDDNKEGSGDDWPDEEEGVRRGRPETTRLETTHEEEEREEREEEEEEEDEIGGSSFVHGSGGREGVRNLATSSINGVRVGTITDVMVLPENNMDWEVAVVRSSSSAEDMVNRYRQTRKEVNPTRRSSYSKRTSLIAQEGIGGGGGSGGGRRRSLLPIVQTSIPETASYRGS